MKTKYQIINIQEQKGFTMLELTLIMLLMGIMTIGAYTMFSPQDIRVDTATLKVIHDIRFAQDRAMITGRNHGFRNTSATQYEIYDSSAGNPTTDPSTQSSMVINLNSNYPNVQFQGNYQWEFNSLGSPVLGGGSSMTLSNGTDTKTFSLTNNTGLINLP